VLLDDINLKGARGILCNITAGSDLSMQEFEVVGDVLESISSTDANVVMGTSIDKEMEGEIRVTVVASGLEGEHARKPMRVVGSDTRKPRETDTFNQYDKPAVERSGGQRRKISQLRTNKEPVQARGQSSRNASGARASEVQPAQGRATAVNYDAVESDGEMTYLDLPTFLRRQAD